MGLNHTNSETGEPTQSFLDTREISASSAVIAELKNRYGTLQNLEDAAAATQRQDIAERLIASIRDADVSHGNRRSIGAQSKEHQIEALITKYAEDCAPASNPDHSEHRRQQNAKANGALREFVDAVKNIPQNTEGELEKKPLKLELKRKLMELGIRDTGADILIGDLQKDLVAIMGRGQG
jgi:hypothetical protein